MHEQSLMNDLMEKILMLAAKNQAKQVTRVSVFLGALSHMSAEHFQEHFSISSKGTIAEKAVLDAFESDDIDDEHANSILLKSIDVV